MKTALGKALAVFAVLAASAAFAQGQGTITTTVLDDGGQPIVNAQVAVEPAGEVNPSGALRECLTDSAGTCSQNLIFGKYHVTAQKKEDGYPNLTFNFYGHGQWPATTELSPKNPESTVIVRLGPKAGFLSIRAIDAVTGESLKHFTVTLHPAADPHDFLSTTIRPDTKVLIPSDEDVLVEVSAKGYQNWHMETQSGAKLPNSVRLHSGESRELTVRLHAD
jgi:hypothetical protein